MGVYGTTYKSAFDGLGKPSIKLEFENNDDLLDFQRRMQEANGGDNPDDTPDGGGNFTPGEQVLDRLSRIATGRPYLKATPGGEVSNEEPDDEAAAWNEQEDMFVPVEGVGNIYEQKIAELKKQIIKNIATLKKSKGDKFIKSHIALKDAITNLRILLDGNRSNKLAYNYTSMPFKDAFEHIVKDDFVKIVFGKHKGGDFEMYDELYAKYGRKKNFNDWRGLGAPGDLYLVRDMRSNRARKEPGDITANKNLQFTKDASQTIKNFNKDLYLSPEIGTDYRKQLKGVTYIHCYISPTGRWEGDTRVVSYYTTIYYYKPLVKNGKDTFKGYDAADRVDVELSDFINVSSRSNGGFEGYVPQSTYKKWFNQALKNQIETFKYAITNKRSNANDAKKELKYFIEYYSNIDKYNAYLIHQYGDPTPLQSQFIADMKEYTDLSIFDGVKSDLGKTANDALYNNNDILDCRGLKPTYKILDSYDAFFAPAQHAATFAGVGLSDTKKLIAEICRAHYKDCARIAQHLKGDTKLQSVFNLWHWLRHNIRYEYDREGREEVRTPLRTWADRRRGVDCDCLSVFAWCVLKCMGYDPAFELVSFNGKAAPSHILVNLDGIRLDRVWFVFNALPPGVTGTEIYRVKTTDNSILAGLFN